MMVYVSVTSANISSFLGEVFNRGIRISKVNVQDSMTGSFYIAEKDLQYVKILAEKRGDLCKVLQAKGVRVRISDLRSRWVFLLFLSALIALSLWVPERIFFICVQGNDSVSTQKILLAAEECGVYFGANRRDIRSVEVKNYLLKRLPEIGWACVNSSGCVANIYVSEQPEQKNSLSNSDASVGIYAAIDGVIVSETVHAGFSQISVGQAVKAGELLVGGVQKDGIVYKYVHPSAEIYAVTNRRLSAVLLDQDNQKVYTGLQYRTYSLIFGKKRIKLLKDSRISPIMCDKIYQEYFITLPGGFVLPAGIAVETSYLYELAETGKTGSAEHPALIAMEQYLEEQMISGRILDQVVAHRTDEILDVRYQCVEMIGREYGEEYDLINGKDN